MSMEGPDRINLISSQGWRLSSWRVLIIIGFLLTSGCSQIQQLSPSSGNQSDSVAQLSFEGLSTTETIQIRIGSALRFEILAYNADGNRLLNIELVWAVEGTIGTFEAGGLFHATQVGQGVIEVHVDKVKARLPIQVVAGTPSLIPTPSPSVAATIDPSPTSSPSPDPGSTPPTTQPNPTSTPTPQPNPTFQPGTSPTPPPTIEPDRQPPQLVSVSSSLTKFSPNGDGRKDQTTIRFEFNEPARGWMEVYNFVGNEVQLVKRVDMTSELKTALEMTWDGADPQGVKVLDGRYFAHMKVEDAAGNKNTSPSILIEVDNTPPQGEIGTPPFTGFSPNGDGENDEIEYDLHLAGSSIDPAILIFEVPGIATAQTARYSRNSMKALWTRTGLVVKRYVFTSLNGGQWETEVVAPFQVSTIPEGVYRCKASFEDEAGNRSSPVEVETRVDMTPPTAGNSIVSSNQEITPNDDGIADKVDIQITVNEPFIGALKFLKEDGTTFKKIQIPWTSETTHTFSWDGRGDFGELEDNGIFTYSYLFDIQDAAGNKTISAGKTVTVYRVPSLIEYAYTTPDPFAPAGNSTQMNTDLVYSIVMDNCQVRVWVGNESDPVKVLFDGVVPQKGEHRVTWDGSFDVSWTGRPSPRDPSRVSVGEYSVHVRVQKVGVTGIAKTSGTVLVDNDPPGLVIREPAIDYQTKKVTLDYAINDKGTVSARVLNVQGNVIRVFPDIEVQVGDNQIIWNYEDGGNLSTLSDNAFYFEISATDPAKNTGQALSNQFRL